MDNIYFDLDGTLTDPKPGITRSIQYALRKLDREAPSEDELTWCIGPPLRASFATLLGDDSLADRGLALFASGSPISASTKTRSIPISSMC
jgi:phosphoglycolate phosphatase